MLRTDYDAEMVAVFREQILKYVVPLAAKLREKQRIRTRVDKLKMYDWGHNFNSGNPKPTRHTRRNCGQWPKNVSELSPETKEFFDFMVKNNLMDLVNRKGKAAGGYCTMFNKYKAPFSILPILMAL